MSDSESKFSQFSFFLCVGILRNFIIFKNANVKVFTTILSLLIKELDKNIRDILATGLQEDWYRFAILIGLKDCDIDYINEKTDKYERICKIIESVHQIYPDNEWPTIRDALIKMGCKEVLEECEKHFKEK